MNFEFCHSSFVTSLVSSSIKAILFILVSVLFFLANPVFVFYYGLTNKTGWNRFLKESSLNMRAIPFKSVTVTYEIATDFYYHFKTSIRAWLNYSRAFIA